jgi:PAS domain S-box-containing protein
MPMTSQEDLRRRIAELEAENLRLRTGFFQPSTTQTVMVPDDLKAQFEVAKRTVHSYFQKAVADPSKGFIEIGGSRYVLIRASALSIDFLDTIKLLYADRGEKEAEHIGRSFLFDIAHAIGMNDARSFHKKMGLTDPIAKLSAGPVHFAYCGWALVDIKPGSNPVPNEEFFIIYEHPYSFEAASWIRADRQSTAPICIMNAGYSSGWCEESFGIELTALEITCRAKGDPVCTFIMAPPHRIKEHVRRHLKMEHDPGELAGLDIPAYFDRKRAEEALRQSEERLRKVIENMPMLMCALDGENTFSVWNRECERVTGYRSEEIVGNPKALRRLMPDYISRAQFLSQWREIEGDFRSWEVPIVGRDGATKIIAWSNIAKHFPVPGWASWGVGADITERKKMEARLVQTDRMASIGLLAAGIAHEMNSPLCVVQGYTNLLLEKIEASEMDPHADLAVLCKDLKKIKGAAERCKTIVENLLTFSYQADEETDWVSLAEIVKRTVEMIGAQCRLNKIVIHDEVSRSLRVWANAKLLLQALTNISIHAIGTMDQGGELTFWAGGDEQGFIAFEIRDTGPGIPQEQQLFDPLFNANSVRKGTGLGLFLAYSVVEKLAGTIMINSARNQGTTFRILLPEKPSTR